MGLNPVGATINYLLTFKLNKMANFEVGKKVIAIKDHCQGAFKRGEIFELLGISKNPCKCKAIVLDIGIKSSTNTGLCIKCFDEYPTGANWLFYITNFAPYDDSLSSISIEELIYSLEKQTV